MSISPTPFQVELDPNRVIRADFFPGPNHSKGLLIICHGFKGFKDWGFFPYVASELAQELDVITFNFSHNGVGSDLLEFTELEKFANNTYSHEREDLHFLIQQVQENKLPLDFSVKNKPLFLLGHSRGAGVSLIYSFDHSNGVQGVISWNGITNVDLFSNAVKEEMMRSGRAYISNARTKQEMPLNKIILTDMEANKDQYNILERVKDTDIPILLVQGTEDFQHLLQSSAQLVKNNPSVSWKQVAGGNHTFNAVHPFEGKTPALSEALRLTKEFIQGKM